jgi:hypothetical protein
MESGYVKEAKPAAEGSNRQVNYELRMKAHPARFLNENSMQEIIDQATDTQAAIILLSLLNVLFPQKD